MMHFPKPNKKGFSLTEVLAAVILLALFTSAILTAIVLARTQLSSISNRTTAIAKAQGVSDSLISAITSGTTDTAVLETLTEADYITGAFAYDASHPLQFKLSSTLVNGYMRYSILVASFYGNKGEYVTLTGTAVNTGTVFLGT